MPRILAAAGEVSVVDTAPGAQTVKVEDASAPSGAGASAYAPEDLALARRCVSGDARAQAVFVERYTGLVFSVCRRRGLPVDAAEDVTQEVFGEAFGGLRGYRGDARLSSWLFVLAMRHVARYFRSPARRLIASGQPGDEGFAGAPVPADHEAESRYLEGDRARRVRRAVESLAEPARSVVLAYYVAEMSVAEIARELEMAAGTVKSHLHRGRRAVRAGLEGLS
jgi:RNA polymerase sigma-70 factor (ECF subfamily)